MIPHRSRLRPSVLYFLALVSVGGGSAFGQRTARQFHPVDKALFEKWRADCERVRDGDPWGAIGDDLESAIAAAGGDVHPDITMYLASIRAAQRQSGDMPENRMDATPEELVTLLTESRLIKGQRGYDSLLSAPLHAHRESATVIRMHWDRLADQEEHDFTDPIIRILHRGRVMIPYLINALRDRTATRCTHITAVTTRPVNMYLRGELAMALLEAIARCRFYVAERGTRFVQHDEAFRESAIRLAEEWWEATGAMSPLDSRSWLISRVSFEQARPMINLLSVQGETGRAIDHLREFLIQPDGAVQFDVARTLAALGDLSGLAAVVQQARAKQKISVDEVRWLVTEGAQHEYRFLRDMLQNSLQTDGNIRNSLSRNILKGVAFAKESRMAVPLLALALDPEDQGQIGPGYPRELQDVLPATATRADFAAVLIQNLTQRNFRYDSDAPPELRRKGIERIRRWWEGEGRSLYGMENARVRRGGGIR